MTEPGKVLRIDSLTLRGVGPYFHGAELKICPLTILCGKNGSGKSTWFNAISLLQQSLHKKKLPWSFDADDADCHDMQLTNARVSNASADELIDDRAAEDRFGPWGTIGASVTAIRDATLLAHDTVQEQPVAGCPAAALLWRGECREKARFRLRLAHSSNGMIGYHQDLVELVFDDVYTIRMMKPPASRDRDSTSFPYTLECSLGFYSPDGDDEVVKVLKFHPRGSDKADWDIEALTSLPSGVSGEGLLNKCVEIVVALWADALRGFFHITAIRDRQEISSLENSSLAPELQELLDDLVKPLDQRKGGWQGTATSEQLIQAIRHRLNPICV